MPPGNEVSVEPRFGHGNLQYDWWHLEDRSHQHIHYLWTHPTAEMHWSVIFGYGDVLVGVFQDSDPTYDYNVYSVIEPCMDAKVGRVF
jgi:hypothetical protein